MCSLYSPEDESMMDKLLRAEMVLEKYPPAPRERRKTSGRDLDEYRDYVAEQYRIARNEVAHWEAVWASLHKYDPDKRDPLLDGRRPGEAVTVDPQPDERYF